MSIKKFTKIDNVFSYSFFDWDKMNPEHGENLTDPDDVFKKNNILFAENGNGKSLLVSILKSLNGQLVELKKHRDRPRSDTQEVKVLLADDREITLSSSGWSDKKLQNKFLIFDKYFIEEFVQSVGPNNTDTVQRRQQLGRNIVYLGNFSEYNNEIDRINTLKDAVSNKTSHFWETEKAKVIGILNGQGITIEELIRKKAEVKKLVKNDLKVKKEQLAKLQVEF